MQLKGRPRIAFGASSPTAPPPGVQWGGGPVEVRPVRPLGQRIAIATLLAAAKTLRWSTVRLLARRRLLAPIWIPLTIWLAGSLLHHAPGGGRTAALMAIIAAGVCGWWAHWLRPRSKPLTQAQHAYAWAVCAAGGTLLCTAAAAGGGPPIPGLAALLAVGAGVPWWWHHRIRAAPAVDQRITIWRETVACDGGALPGSTLTDLTPLSTRDDDWSATIKLPPGRFTTERAVSATSRIASAFGLPVSAVAVEPPPGSEAHLAKLGVYTSDPLQKPQPWPGPQLFNPETGVAAIGIHQDKSLAAYRFWQPGSGAVHDLIAGTTGSGKSRLLDQLLAIERSSPLMTSIVIDPQQGQSLPDWRDAVAVYATSADQGMVVLEALRDEMYRRNHHLANVEWTDHKSRLRRGKSYFEPTVEMPLLCVTIDEAHAVLALDGARAICEEIAKMSRKCGIKLRLVVQVPLLDQLGGSSTLRDMLTGGNIVVLRTADRSAGPAIIGGKLPVDPALLPREYPDGSSTGGLGYIIGPAARAAVQRLWHLDDPYDYASIGETTTTGTEHIQQALTDAEQDTRRLSETTPPMTDRDAPPALAVVTPIRAAPATTRTRILDYLTSAAGPVHTGVIARKLDIPLGTVSTTLKRLTTAGATHRVRRGVWTSTKDTATAA